MITVRRSLDGPVSICRHNNRRRLMIVALFLLVPCLVRAQIKKEMRDSVVNVLNAALAREKAGYEVSRLSLVVLDMVKGRKSNRINGFFEDKRDEFKGTVFFIALPRRDNPLRKPGGNSLQLGYERLSCIKWISNGPMNGRGGEIYAFMDLTGDGFQEIVCVTGEGPGVTPDSEYMWIFGWDGKSWNQVNPTDQNGKSKINVSIGRFEFKGPAAKGAFEILCTGDGSDKLFRWDGSTFSLVAE